MPVAVRLPRPPRHGFLDHLRARLAPEVTLTVEEDGPCDVLVDGTPDRARIEKSVGLRALVIPYAGVPRATRELLREFPAVAVHNLHHNAAPTAELAIALLLAAGKTLVPLDRALRRHDWRPRYAPERQDDLLCAGRTALVLGYGAIGRRVAAACRGLGMQVMATRRSGTCTGPDEVFLPDALDSLLPRAHALFVCLPSTGETDGLLGAGRLALLPDGAVLVNVGRGPIVDETALFRELESGRLAAGLDVWYRYPESEEARADTAPATQPFHELENVVLSPHRAGLCAETERLRAEGLAEMLNGAARGEPMPHRVDLDRGY
ncbi:MAG: NAD(P)-dependent oxidoreductase [Planctomycetota bacterium]